MEGHIEIEVRFLNAEDGGRQWLPNLKAGTYRPHLRVPPDKMMLGVEFVDGPPILEPNVAVRATLRPLYAPSIDYSTLAVGTHFDVVEGPRVVAHGVIVQRD
jgi:hypothetical protein